MLKVAQLRLPDPVLRKASEGSSAALQNRKLFQQVKSVQQNEVEATGWISWNKWYADYVKITTGVNAMNRLPPDVKEKPTHKDVNNTTENSSELLSLCKKESYEVDCGGKTPVVFIHGYSLGGGLGGGEGTWGKLPELIKAEGYAVFEFKWRTNARFADVAADFAGAIRLIQEKSKKKVHIVAHSFGGLVSRAYLQNYATGSQYDNNVQSLVTLGTPHSGIFDKDGTYHGLEFKKGQDSDTFEACMQISCHEAGESTPEAYTIDPLIAKNIEINDFFGVDKNQGRFIAQIQDTSGEHDLPVDVLALIGLPAWIEYYHGGDGLITYAGQRFSREWENSKIAQGTPLAFGAGEVTEKILGVSDYDPDAVPGVKPSSSLRAKWFDNNDFRGYYHSTALPSYYNEGLHGAGEAEVKDSSNICGTDAPHAALSEIKAWLKPSDDAEPLSINLHLQVVDADTQQPVSFAAVYFNINGILACSTENYGVTDTNGNLTKKIEFHKFSKYTALISADDYISEEFDTGYATNISPALSGTEFGTIKLRKGKVSVVTSATGRIWMDKNLGASRVATSMTDTEAYGDLYQWGRGTDGHEKRTSGMTATLSASDNPGHPQFITASSEPYDWRSPKNDSLWQGVNGINNPCPTGFRLPTAEEWQEEIDSWNSKDAAGAFASPLKLITANRRFNENGGYCGLLGGYWSSTVYWGNLVNYILFYYNYGEVYLSETDRSYGFSVRCIKDMPPPPLEDPKPVTSATGRIWLDRNLGASRVAMNMDDELAYGDLYQWGRGKDGHEKRTSGMTTTASSVDTPNNSDFIMQNDWRSPQNNNLWQGVNGINNPCSDGFRLPTDTEWQEEMNSWNSKDAVGAFASPLKLVTGGYRSAYDGNIYNEYYWGYYWSSTIANTFFSIPFIYYNNSTSNYNSDIAVRGGGGAVYILRANGGSVRCIKD
jgi:uncharacterized protein (TIGR02145 family)